MTLNVSQSQKLLAEVESTVRDQMQAEEAAHGRKDKPPNSLWGHALRVALIAERLGLAEGVSSAACRLAGIFHDAGKFGGGCYHQGDTPEEERSVVVLREITENMGLDPLLLDQVEESILQLYRDAPDPTQLTKILFDADNLDKLGTLGVANYFIKAGLRGGGITPSVLYRTTVELTYARHAPRILATESGRELARKRAPDTISFYKNLLDSLREDGLYDFRIDEVYYDGLTIDVVSPVECDCGEKLSRRIWDIPGLKCFEIHLEHSCSSCGPRHELQFCRPRLIGPN